MVQTPLHFSECGNRSAALHELACTISMQGLWEYSNVVLPVFTGPAFEDALFVADGEAARTLMASEAQLGMRSDFPDTFRE